MLIELKYPASLFTEQMVCKTSKHALSTSSSARQLNLVTPSSTWIGGFDEQSKDAGVLIDLIALPVDDTDRSQASVRTVYREPRLVLRQRVSVSNKE